MKDPELISQLRSAHPDKAFRQLYQHFPMTKKFIRNHGGNTEDAEDVFQEALIIFCRNVHRADFVLTVKPSTYLFSVCKYLWKDVLKKRSRTFNVTITSELELREEETLEHLLQQEEKAKQAEKALSALGERCWQIIRAFYFEHLSMQSIAERMGFQSEKIAKNQKYKCLEKAREQLN